MKPTPAIVQPAVDLAAIVHKWDMLDGKEQRAMDEFRAAKAKLLIEARGAFNSRGDGFKDFVENKLRIAFRTAYDWMKDAGYVAPKKPGAGRKDNHCENGNDSSATTEDTGGGSDNKGGAGTDEKTKPENGTDPENYRTAFLLRANAAVEYAMMTPPLLAEYYRLKPRRREKHHQEFIAMARRAADAWTDLANKLERENG